MPCLGLLFKTKAIQHLSLALRCACSGTHCEVLLNCSFILEMLPQREGCNKQLALLACLDLQRMGSVFCSSFAPFFTLYFSLCFFCPLAPPSPIWERSAEAQEAVRKRRGPLRVFGLCVLPTACPAWEPCPQERQEGWQRCRGGTCSGTVPFRGLRSTRQAELACTFPSAGAGEGKEHARRKYSCCRALLPSVQWEHVRGGQTQKGRFRKRV